MKCFIFLLYCLLAVNFSAISQNKSKPAKAKLENQVKQLSYELHPWWTAPIGSFKEGKPAKNK